ARTAGINRLRSSSRTAPTIPRGWDQGPIAAGSSRASNAPKGESMKLLAVVFLAVPSLALAQPRGVIDTNQIEAVVTVTKVDAKARTVTMKGPQGNLRTLQVPPEAQNLDKVKPGDRFKVVYAEALVLALTPGGGKPSASVDQQVKVAPKGGT